MQISILSASIATLFYIAFFILAYGLVSKILQYNDPEKLKSQQTISLAANQNYKVVKYKMSEEVINLILLLLFQKH